MISLAISQIKHKAQNISINKKMSVKNSPYGFEDNSYKKYRNVLHILTGHVNPVRNSFKGGDFFFDVGGPFGAFGAPTYPSIKP